MLKRLAFSLVLAAGTMAHGQQKAPPPPPPAQACWTTYIGLLKDCQEQRFTDKTVTAACLQGANIFLSSCLAHAYGLKLQQPEMGMPPSVADPVDLNEDGRVDVLDAYTAIEVFTTDLPMLSLYFQAWAVRAQP